MSKRARIIAAVVGLVVVVGVVAAIGLGSQGGGPEVETATAAEKELAVTVTASGRVDAGVRADVFPPTAGSLDEIFVSDGETVTAGQKIARLATGPLELQVAQARAGLSQAQAQLAAVDDQAPSGADIAAAQANVSATLAAYRSAQTGLAAVGDSAPSQAQIDAAEAGTVAARNAYDAALAAYTAYPSNDATRAALRASADQSYVAYLSARATEQQLKSTDLDAARAQARAGVAQAYAAYKGAQAQLAKLTSANTGEARNAAEASVRSAAEALALAQENLDNATLEAPIDGVVIFNAPGAAVAAAAGGGAAAGGDITEGSSVSPAAAPFSVVDLDALRFTAEIDEADIERVAVGMSAMVTLDSFPGEEFASRVVRVNPVAQATATGGTVFEVELVIDDTGKQVLIGMKGDATIEVSSRGAALTVPVEALFSEGGTDYVYVVEGGKLKKSEITVGAQTDTEVEVLGGLQEGDVVALSGSTQYSDGMAVRTK